MVIIGTPPDDAEDDASVLDVARVNGDPANRSWALLRLIVTRLLLCGSDIVVAGIVFTSVLDIFTELAMGKCGFFKHACRCSNSSR